MASSDFILWDDDDINLDLLLEEYTDYETENFATQTGNRRKSKGAKFDDSTCIYICPKCPKELKSISGFRGHVSKKHGLHVKASEHRSPKCAENVPDKEMSQACEPTPKPTQLIEDGVYDIIFPCAYDGAISEIKSNPLHTTFTPAMSAIADFCANNTEVQESLRSVFNKLTRQPINLDTTHDREKFFNNFHKIRSDDVMRDIQDSMKNNDCPHKDSINDFMQIFLLEIINCLFQQLGKHMKQISDVDEKDLGSQDQKVLYYISGYIVHALKKKYSKIKKSSIRDEKLACVKLLSSSNEGSFHEYSTWLDKKDRGGLKRPSDDLFNFIRSMELVVRKNVSVNLSANSLQKCVLKEKVLENYTTKMCRDKLFPIHSTDDSSDEDETNVDIITDDVVNLFLTVRGYATARRERKQLANISQSRKGDSFRQALKPTNMQTDM